MLSLKDTFAKRGHSGPLAVFAVSVFFPRHYADHPADVAGTGLALDSAEGKEYQLS
jgi:hypothetical protein